MNPVWSLVSLAVALKFYMSVLKTVAIITAMSMNSFLIRMICDPLILQGLVYNMDELLKSYPDKVIAADIKSAMFETFDLDDKKIRADAKLVKRFIQGKSVDDITAEFHGEGVSLISEIAKVAKV